MIWAPLLLLGFVAAGCSTTRPTTLPHGEQAYALIAPAAVDGAEREYRLGPLDTVTVVVFQEPELSFQNLQIDAQGNVLYPLIGSFRAAGKTAAELSGELAQQLNRYLVDPQVTVAVTSSVSQRVIVEGSVAQPGAYEIRGSSSLLEALALARSPTQVANLDEVVIFRTISGERMGAVFDVARIRAGLDPDPEIIGGDVVVVGLSGIKQAWRDFLQAAPLLNVFTRLGL